MNRMNDDLQPISNEEFWDAVSELPPLLRLGYSNGPGAFIASEPWSQRRCTVTGKDDNTYSVYVVLKGAGGHAECFEHAIQLTVHEFKALCERIMPGIGLCAWRWGAELLDHNGGLRTDLEFPVQRS
jgi:hypothetical protein